MEKSESIKELATALSAAQGEMPAVPMGSTNPFLKNKYANLGDVIKTVQPVLAAHGLAVSQAVYCDGPTIGVETILMHSSGEWLSSKMGTIPGDDKGISQVQAAGKVITYLRRYTLSSVLGVYADEDADGNTDKPAPVKTSQQPVVIPQVQANPSDLRYQPEHLREYIQKLVVEYATYECNDKQKALCAATLDQCFDGDDADRHAIQYYLTGKQSMKEMTAPEIRALLKWLEPAKDAQGKYWPNGMSVREANAALSAAFIDAGQAPLI